MADSFELQIGRFVEKAKENADLVVRKIALDVFGRVIAKSPVDTGRFKSNWLCAVGSIPEGTTVAIDISSAITRMERAALGAKAGDVVYLVNNLPYARRLEYGHSKQAPGGMVRLTVAEFGAIVNDAAREVNK
jgi:hypothetical protein